MGVQIAYLAILAPLVLGLIWLSFKVADRAFDALERGRYAKGIARFALALAIGPGAALVLLPSGYWLAFNGGIGRLLGT